MRVSSLAARQDSQICLDFFKPLACYRLACEPSDQLHSEAVGLTWIQSSRDSFEVFLMRYLDTWKLERSC